MDSFLFSRLTPFPVTPFPAYDLDGRKIGAIEAMVDIPIACSIMRQLILSLTAVVLTACQTTRNISSESRFDKILHPPVGVYAKRALNIYSIKRGAGTRLIVTPDTFTDISSIPLVARVPEGQPLYFARAVRETDIGGSFDHLNGYLFLNGKRLEFEYPLGVAGGDPFSWMRHFKYSLEVR